MIYKFYVVFARLSSQRVLSRNIFQKIRIVPMKIRIWEHPFKLKGGGGWLWFFLGKKISVRKFDWKKMSVSEMGRKNILLALCALKMIVFVEEKNNVATIFRKSKILLRCDAKKNILTLKKTIGPLTPLWSQMDVPLEFFTGKLTVHVHWNRTFSHKCELNGFLVYNYICISYLWTTDLIYCEQNSMLHPSVLHWRLGPSCWSYGPTPDP